jgi:hypothetical protein
MTRLSQKKLCDLGVEDFSRVVEINSIFIAGNNDLRLFYVDDDSGKKEGLIIHPRGRTSVVQSNFRRSGSIYLIVRLIEVISGHRFIKVEEERFCRDDTEEALQFLAESS